MPREDWELYVAGADGGEPRRLTHEIQHDIDPQFVSHGRRPRRDGGRTPSAELSVRRGERRAHPALPQQHAAHRSRRSTSGSVRPDGQVGRHRERAGRRHRLARAGSLPHRPSADGHRRGAARAGPRRWPARSGTSGQRGTRDVRADRARGAGARCARSPPPGSTTTRTRFRASTPSTSPSPATSRRSSICSRHLRSFGYEPELQWFEPLPGARSANVVATLRGTADPELQYVVGNHFDSVEEGPGADDNTSGTTALLEAARVLARRPQPATIRFVWFTGGGIGAPRQPGVRAPGDRGGGPGRRRAQQRHGRAG